MALMAKSKRVVAHTAAAEAKYQLAMRSAMEAVPQVRVPSPMPDCDVTEIRRMAQ
jgi:hypothetical protein